MFQGVINVLEVVMILAIRPSLGSVANIEAGSFDNLKPLKPRVRTHALSESS